MDRLKQWDAWVKARDPYLLRQIRSMVGHVGRDEAAAILRVPLATLERWWSEIEGQP